VSGTPSRLYDGRVVLVTGGTKGIGLGTALTFAEHGARLVLTFKWGSADEDEVKQRFAAVRAVEPLIIQADVGSGTDTEALYAVIRDRCGPIEVLVNCAAPAVTVRSVDDYTERGFLKTMRASTWPTVDYTLAAKKHLGRYPRYVITMSSDGPDRFMPGYDFVACSKAAVETLTRYLSYRLRGEDVRVNVVRARAIETDSLAETFGSDFYGFLRRLAPAEWFMPVGEVANAVFALCSGMFDAMTGQVLMVDRGNAFVDNISTLYEQREALGL
jgi:NAD(P)-dependent dehydrogenase (short-subunit alcohol dehydrogenase family)